jgi:hypothetical protein
MAARRRVSTEDEGDSRSATREEMEASEASAAQERRMRWMPAAAAGLKAAEEERSSLPQSLKGSEQEESPLSL